ncbi:MAG: ABC transporter permease [Gemmatimonadota bacterium]
MIGFEEFFAAMVRAATPLAFAALGEAVSERAGVINVGLEGVIIGGCLGAAIGAASGNVWLGVALGCLSGVALASVFGVFAISLRADQILAGTALTIGAYGLTGTLYRSAFGSTGIGLSLPTLAPVEVPILSSLPVVGPALFHQPVLTYLLYAATVACTWVVFRTRAGLSLRAVGEYPPAAIAAGIDPQRVRWAALLTGGALGGLGGATLVLAQTGTFAEQMSAGRGFIAIGIVALGRWHPAWVLGSSLLFGAASALQVQLQATGSGLPYQLFLALPYVLTLLVLAISWERRPAFGWSFVATRAPAMLGRNTREADSAK